jgi:hypothetical protein
MKFSLEIGEVEKHSIVCETNPLFGLFVIKVDNIERAKTRYVVLPPLRQTHSLDVGIKERLHLTVEKVRGFFSGETHRVFVNGRLIKCITNGKATETDDQTEVAAN